MPDATSDPAAATWRRQRWVACGLAAQKAGAADPAADPVAAVAAEVGRLGCVQAQEFDMTLWSLAQRTGCTRDEALAALRSRAVLRTHVLRTTWHFLRREDLATIQTATAERVHRSLRPALVHLGIGDEMLGRWGDHLSDVLAAGPLTRPEIADRLIGTEFELDGTNPLGFLMMWAELEQIVASGPPRGLTHTYQLVDAVEPPDPEAAVAWLMQRFFASHGPSTVGDASSWSSLTLTAVRRALARLGDVVQAAPILGSQRHWIGPLSEGSWPDQPTVALLNGYDEYIAGLDARSKALLDPGRLYRGRPGTPVAVLMVDGMLAGHWRRTRTAKQLRVDVSTLRPLTEPERAGLEHETDRYAAFAEQDVELRVGPAQ